MEYLPINHIISQTFLGAGPWFGLLLWLHRLNEPRHKKTNVLHMRKQRRRSASQLPKLISAFVFVS